MQRNSRSNSVVILEDADEDVQEQTSSDPLLRYFPTLSQSVVLLSTTAALERDVLWHGKLILTSTHLLFYGKLFTSVVKVQLQWIDVLHLEKRSVGLFNGIRVGTLHSKYFFTMLKRDNVFLKMSGMWEEVLSRSRVEGVEMLAGMTPTSTENLNLKMFQSDGGEVAMHETISNTLERDSNQRTLFRKSRPPTAVVGDLSSVAGAAGGAADLPLSGVSCGCADHLKHELYNEVINGLDQKQLFHLIFEEQGAEFMKSFYKMRKSSGFDLKPWMFENQGSALGRRQFNYSVQFKAPLLPASTTSCMETQVLMKRDEYVSVVECVTKTPNVPYGDSFDVRSRYCLQYESPTSVRLKVSMQVEFIKSVLWESQIEKGAIGGVSAHVDDLLKVIRGQTRWDYLPSYTKKEVEKPPVVELIKPEEVAVVHETQKDYTSLLNFVLVAVTVMLSIYTMKRYVSLISRERFLASMYQTTSAEIYSLAQASVSVEKDFDDLFLLLSHVFDSLGKARTQLQLMKFALNI